MWQWEISKGRMSHPEPDGKVFLSYGYSGAPDDKNNPAAVGIKNHGPIPPGNYIIHAPRDTTTHGPYVLPLEPSTANEMYGRGGFLIHGDKIGAPGTASEGCIILDRSTRQKIWESNDHQLTVVI